MALYELVTASDGGDCTVLMASNDISVCRNAAETDVKDWMGECRLKKVHLWLLHDGVPIEDIFVTR